MKSKIQSVLCVLAGLVFINAGLDKFLHYMPIPKDLPEKTVRVGKLLMDVGWLMPLVGTFEILGGLLLLVPKTRPLGALMLTPLLVGILVANIDMTPAAVPIVVILMAIVGWVILDNKQKLLFLIGK